MTKNQKLAVIISAFGLLAVVLGMWLLGREQEFKVIFTVILFAGAGIVLKQWINKRTDFLWIPILFFLSDGMVFLFLSLGKRTLAGICAIPASILLVLYIYLLTTKVRNSKK
jgi:hypothetical protein